MQILYHGFTAKSYGVSTLAWVRANRAQSWARRLHSSGHPWGMQPQSTIMIYILTTIQLYKFGAQQKEVRHVLQHSSIVICQKPQITASFLLACDRKGAPIIASSLDYDPFQWLREQDPAVWAATPCWMQCKLSLICSSCSRGDTMAFADLFATK